MVLCATFKVDASLMDWMPEELLVTDAVRISLDGSILLIEEMCSMLMFIFISLSSESSHITHEMVA